MNINNPMAQLRTIAPYMAENMCIISRNVCDLKQIEGMSCQEFWSRAQASIPLKLYKYFPNVESEDKENYSIQALKNNTVYMQSPNNFDDVYDSAINIDYVDFQRCRLKEYCRKCGLETIETLGIDELYLLLAKHVEQSFAQFGDYNHLICVEPSCEIERLSNELFVGKLKLNHLSGADFENAIRITLFEEYEKYYDELKNKFRVSCFTTTPFSQLMWSAYADEHRGFCIEYTIDRSNPSYTNIIQNLFPLIYCKTRPNITERLVAGKDKGITQESLMDLYREGALRKSVDWAFQDEWRLLLPLGSVRDNYNVEFFPVTKVFLGNRMSPAKRKEIITMCKEKRIPYVGVVCKQNAFEMEECSDLCESCGRCEM